MTLRRYLRKSSRFATLLVALAGMFVLAATSAPAADRARLTAFLDVTGFDVALDSIRFSAASAPRMLGLEASAFGSEWERVSEEVFDTALMRTMAVDILSQTLSDEMLAHAAGFYASALGQRLVAVENASHSDPDDDGKSEVGKALVSQMVKEGSPRLEVLKRMNRAIGAADTSLRSLQEIQVRFILAANAAGLFELNMDADELRALVKSREARMRIALQQSALSGAAYVYRDIGTDDLVAYAEALENPVMMRVYELMFAVQHEIMANRFEELASRMAGMTPGQDI